MGEKRSTLYVVLTLGATAAIAPVVVSVLAFMLTAGVGAVVTGAAIVMAVEEW